jgi:hypothetical protein
VRAPFPANTLAELIAYANAKPGKINIGTPPIGSPQHVAGELFRPSSCWVLRADGRRDARPVSNLWASPLP